GNDFFNWQPGKIWGYKYNDQNGNGSKDTGEPGLQGWTINLGGDKTASTTTNANGYYEFTNLPAGNYTLSEVQQAGWTQTGPANNLINVTLTAGDTSSGNDFFNWQPGKIWGYKYNDQNGNGSWDEGEPGLQGWTINLGGDKTASTTTGSDGYYEFPNLPAGDYTLSEVQQQGWTQTNPAGNLIEVELDAGEVSGNNNFFNWQPGCIGGYKWNDLDGDGTWDAGEPALSGW
ncbi:MAG: SdrD B-like domain-containing protein, partial [Syntrophomonadaceae bacterium]|nr:SdrD B-like domain-containing protein [Syntrophomonadaceae bacterium]